MKMPKCPKTVTGKHKWGTLSWYTYEDVLPLLPRCAMCGMFDDRKKTINPTNKE